jgi:hypothetical protein
MPQLQKSWFDAGRLDAPAFFVVSGFLNLDSSSPVLH